MVLNNFSGLACLRAALTEQDIFQGTPAYYGWGKYKGYKSLVIKEVEKQGTRGPEETEVWQDLKSFGRLEPNKTLQL